MSIPQRPYDFRNCQSLFGYAAAVHKRSGGICELCGCGATALDFDLWRQLTVEHLIGEKQGGYLRDIRRTLAQRFPAWSPARRVTLAEQIDVANTITACSFCNSTTSRDQAPISMSELIMSGPEDQEAALAHVTAALADVLLRKQRDVAWKLESVRAAFENSIAPTLREQRSANG